MRLGRVFAVLLLAAFGASQAKASGAVVSIKTVEGKLQLTVQTEVGQYYRLQCRASLTSGAWENVGGEFLATGSQRVLTVEPGADSCMFRVIKVEPGVLAPDPPPDPPSPPTG